MTRGHSLKRLFEKRLAGKVAVVTGGSTGMGLATAQRFVREGMDHVFITGRRKEVLDRAVAEIGEKVTGVQGMSPTRTSSINCMK